MKYVITFFAAQINKAVKNNVQKENVLIRVLMATRYNSFLRSFFMSSSFVQQKYTETEKINIEILNNINHNKELLSIKFMTDMFKGFEMLCMSALNATLGQVYQ